MLWYRNFILLGQEKKISSDKLPLKCDLEYIQILINWYKMYNFTFDSKKLTRPDDTKHLDGFT